MEDDLSNLPKQMRLEILEARFALDRRLREARYTGMCIAKRAVEHWLRHGTLAITDMDGEYFQPIEMDKVFDHTGQKAGTAAIAGPFPVPPLAPEAPGRFAVCAPSFRKKPVQVQAFQMTIKRRADNIDWPEWLNRAWQKDIADVGSVFPEKVPNSNGHDLLCIHTLEGVMRVEWDDWIIQGIQGELYPCKPDIFAATYEAVS